MGKKLLSMLLSVAMVLSIITSIPMAAFAAPVFFDDFESYDENTYPSSFAIQYNGTGDANQKVMTTSGYQGVDSKVFRLEGAHYWSSEQYVSLPSELPDILIADAWIKPVSGVWPGEIAFRNLGVGPWGTRYAAVWFSDNGNILAVRNGNDGDTLDIGDYTLGQWCQITLKADLLLKTFDVYINGIKAAEDLPTHPSLTPTTLSLIAGNLGTNEIYFDEVGLYSDMSEVIPPEAPLLQSAGTTEDGELILLAFDKAMADPSGKHSQFTVMADENSIPVEAAALDGLDDTTIQLTLGETLYDGQTVEVSYTAGDIQAADEGLLASFEDIAVENDSTVQATTLEGSGTLADPYKINDLDELSYVAEQVNLGTNYGEAYYIMMADIDAGETGWIPIGNDANPFKGHFDGNGYKVTNLSIGTPSAYNNTFANLGLFGIVAANASVKNVGVEGLSIYSNASANTGGVAGYNQGTIDHCYATGQIFAYSQLGGLIGWNKGNVLNSYAAVDLTASGSSAGGLIGSNEAGNITNCFATGNVSAGAYPHAGGLVGYTVNFAGTSYIQNCYATGDVSGSAWGYLGGLYGRNYQGMVLINNFWNQDAQIIATELHGYTPQVHGSGEGCLAKASAEMKTMEFAGLLNTWIGDAEIYYGWELIPGTNDSYPVLKQALGDSAAPEVEDGTIRTSGITRNAVTLTWNKANDNTTPATELQYGVYRSMTDNIADVAGMEANGTLVGGFAADMDSKQITALVSDTGYYFNILVKDAAGNKTAYDMVMVKTAKAASQGSSSFEPEIEVTTNVSGPTTTNSTKISSNTSLGSAHGAITSAIMDALLEKADATEGTSKEDGIKVVVDAELPIHKLQISVPQAEFGKLASETNADFGMESPFVSITFDGKAVDTISGAASGGEVVITAERLADVNGRPVYDLTVTNSGKTVSDFQGGHATVSIPYTLKPGENPNAVVIYYLAGDGTLKPVRGHYDAALKAVVFKTPHFSRFSIGYHPVSFTDVSAQAWYKSAVDFIAARGITSGTGDGRFSPEAKLTRAQFVVLLMNAYQIGVQTQAGANFADAGSTDYTGYLWTAKGLGIVNGIGNNLFAPEKAITRQEMFAMLYNALKVLDEVPAAVNTTELSSFTDAAHTADWAKEAMSALVKAGIVGGYNNSLHPTAATTRGEIAQVLYNLMTK